MVAKSIVDIDVNDDKFVAFMERVSRIPERA
ncbi:Uncharacterised protein [Klebsiella pneumoniae]|nr:Uncharacterised protein [Klebsiella pneumoniae]